MVQNILFGFIFISCVFNCVSAQLKINELKNWAAAVQQGWLGALYDPAQGAIFMAYVPADLNIANGFGADGREYCGDYTDALKLAKRHSLPDTRDYDFDGHITNPDKYYTHLQGKDKITEALTTGSGNERRLVAAIWSHRCFISRITRIPRSSSPHYEELFIYYMLTFYPPNMPHILVYSNKEPCDYGAHGSVTDRQCSRYVSKLGLGQAPFQRLTGLWPRFVYVSAVSDKGQYEYGYLNWRGLMANPGNGDVPFQALTPARPLYELFAEQKQLYDEKNTKVSSNEKNTKDSS